MGNIGDVLRNTITKSDMIFIRRGLDDLKKMHKIDKSGDPLHRHYICGLREF